MAYDIDALPGLIELGNLNELGVSTIEFDVTEWLADYPLGVLNITYIRPGETTVYPVNVTGVSIAAPTSGSLVLTLADGVYTLTWTVSDAVTAIAGSGSIVVELAEGGTIKKRSNKVQSFVADGHAAAGTPPEPLADYIEKWSAVDATVTESVPGTAPTATVTQDVDGTHFAFDLPTDLTADATASTLDTGEPATASVTQDGTGAHFAFGLPRGLQGIQGASAYEQAVTGGYTGTLEDFYLALNEVNAAVQAAEDAEDSASAAAASAAQLAAGVASPAATYANLAALISANPDHSKTYITLDDGKWCYHNGTAFVAGTAIQVDLFMCMGQSNMAGRGTSAQAPAVPAAYGYEFRAVTDPTKLYNIAEPFGVGENVTGGIDDGASKTGSLISAFAIAYYESTKMPAVYVSASEGGSRISTWQAGQFRLNDAIDRLDTAVAWLASKGITIRHKYVLWLQGESDGDDGLAKRAYYTSLAAMVDEMVDNHGIDKCLLIRVGNNRDTPLLYDKIIDAQTQLGKTHDDVVMVHTKLAGFADRGMMKDAFHYTQAGLNELGSEAGKNAAAYAITGIKPVLDDYENDNVYYPFAVNGDSKVQFTFDIDHENGTFDVVPCGTLSGGVIDTNSVIGYKYMPTPIKLSPIREWSIEFTVDPLQVVATGQSGVILANHATQSRNFVHINNVLNRLRLRDSESNTFNFTVASATLDAKHSYCITYDGAGSMVLYIDGTIHQTLSATTIADFEFSHLLGGYFSDKPYDAEYYYRGLCYYLGYINKKLQTRDMHVE